MAPRHRTGYVILPKAWKSFLEEGLGQTFNLAARPDLVYLGYTSSHDKDIESNKEEREEQEDELDPEAEEERRKDREREDRWHKEFNAFSAYKQRFRCIRRAASWEVRSNLEIPHSFVVDVGESSIHLLYIPTGTVKTSCPSSIDPSDRDSAAMALFIDTANSLIPDDTTRTKAGLTLANVRFLVVADCAIQYPAYTEEEVEEIRQLRKTQARLVPT